MNTFYRLLILSFVLNCNFPPTISAAVADSLELPIAAFSTEDTLVCASAKLFLKNQSLNYNEVIWEVDGIDSIKVSEEGNAEVFISQTGTYSVSLIVENDCGSDTVTQKNLVRVTDRIEAFVNTTYLGHECGIGQKYEFCFETDFQIAEFYWLRDCLTTSNDGRCCEVGFPRSTWEYENGVSLTSKNGCQKFFHGWEVFGDYEDVSVLWISGPLYFCEGEPAEIPSGTAFCYPPGCTDTYEEVNTSVPGDFKISAEVQYRECIKNVEVPVTVLPKPDFAESHDTVCVNSYLYFNFENAISNPQMYFNGFESNSNPNPHIFFPYVGTFEITASNNVTEEFGTECFSKDTMYVTVIESPIFTLNYKQDICRNTEEFVTIKTENIIGIPPYSYQWWVNATAIEADTNVLILPLSELPNDSYSVRSKITHANGCASQEQSVNFTIDICNNISSHPSNQFSIYQINAEQIALKLENIIGGKINARLYNISGQTLLEQTFFPSNSTLEETISIQNINSGLYILQLEESNGKVFSQKIWIK